MAKGIIYILLNPLFPKYLKIGKTQKNSAEERAREMYKQASAAIPMEFIVAYECVVSDCDLVEKLVHQKLANKRINYGREYFELPLKDALTAIEKVIAELSQQGRLEIVKKQLLEPTSNKKWWSDLSFAWKQIFRNHLKINYNPSQIELLGAIHNIIDHSQDERLRKIVCNFISDKRFIDKLVKWYESMEWGQRLFNSYLPYDLSEQEIVELLGMKEISCNNNLAILDLHPLSKLSKLELINCTNTNISDCSPLRLLPNLKKVHFNYTNIESLTPLIALSSLEEIECYGTRLSEKEIDVFKSEMPNCEIVTDIFLTNTPILKSKRK